MTDARYLQLVLDNSRFGWLLKVKLTGTGCFVWRPISQGSSYTKRHLPDPRPKKMRWKGRKPERRTGCHIENVFAMHRAYHFGDGIIHDAFEHGSPDRPKTEYTEMPYHSGFDFMTDFESDLCSRCRAACRTLDYPPSRLFETVILNPNLFGGYRRIGLRVDIVHPSEVAMLKSKFSEFLDPGGLPLAWQIVDVHAAVLITPFKPISKGCSCQ